MTVEKCMYQVTKQLPVDDGYLAVGEIVDASGWRNVKALVAGRYLVPLTSVYVKQDDALETKVVKAKAVRPVGATKEA